MHLAFRGKTQFLLQSPFVYPSAMSGASPGAPGVLEWSEDGAVEAFLRYSVSVRASTAPNAFFATQLLVNKSTDTKTHRDEGVSISEAPRARLLQSNTIEACANILRGVTTAADEIKIALVSMADESIPADSDEDTVDTASELWMDA